MGNWFNIVLVHVTPLIAGTTRSCIAKLIVFLQLVIASVIALPTIGTVYAREDTRV